MKTLQIAIIVSDNGEQRAAEIQEFDLDSSDNDPVEFLIEAENMLYAAMQAGGLIGEGDA